MSITIKDANDVDREVGTVEIGGVHYQAAVFARAATGTLTSVAQANVNTALKAANSARLGLTIFNESDSALNVAYGFNASDTAYSERIEPRTSLTVPPWWAGAVNGIWVNPSTGSAESGSGNARVTEYTV